MTYQQVVNAKKAIDEISKFKYPISISYTLFKFKKRIDELFQFEVEQEKKQIDQFHGRVQHDGTIVFQNQEECSACTEAINQILHSEISEDIEPVVICLQDIPDVQMTPETIDLLDGFVLFTENH